MRRLAVVLLLGFACSGGPVFSDPMEIARAIDCEPRAMVSAERAADDRRRGVDWWGCHVGTQLITMYVFGSSDLQDDFIASTQARVQATPDSLVIGDRWMVRAPTRTLAEQIADRIGGRIGGRIEQT